jgi:hypothetical protein
LLSAALLIGLASSARAQTPSAADVESSAIAGNHLTQAVPGIKTITGGSLDIHRIRGKGWSTS